MADVSSLNFDVILNDSEFKKKVDEDIALAHKLNLELSQALEIKGKVAQAVAENKKLGATLDENAGKQKKLTDETKKTTDETKKHKDAVKDANAALVGTEGLMRTIAQLTGVAFGAVGVRRFVSELVNVTGQFEVQKMALTSMLQDAEKADEIFNTLRKNALNSPYTFQDLSKYAKQLTAFNIDADQLVETEKRLADVAAGLGVDMGRIILAYGQVKAAGVLKGTELRQFTEAGVPLLQSLAEQIQETEGHAISLSEVFQRISKKEIPFEMVEEAFRRMTSEGGKFYNMQEVLVNTLQGKIGKLRDVWQQALYDLGMSKSGALKAAVDGLTVLAGHIEEIGKVLLPVIAAFGTYYTALVLAAAGQKLMAIATLAKEFIALTRSVGLANAAITVFGTATKAVAASLGIISLLAVAFVEVYQAVKKSREEQEAYNNAVLKCTQSIEEEKNELDKLMKVAKDEKKSMTERKEAIDTINSQYSEYINNLGMEKVSVDNLTTSYQNLTAAIADKYLEELKEQTVGSRRASVNDAEAALIGFNEGLLKNNKLNNVQRGALLGSVRRIIANRNPLIDREGLYNLIEQEYRKNGISLTNRQRGDLYELTEGLVVSSDELKRAEKGFDDFAKGYASSMGLVKRTTESVTQGNEEPVWTPMKDDKKSGKSVAELLEEAEAAMEKNSLSQIAKDDEAAVKALDKETDSFVKNLDDRQKAVEKFDEFLESISGQQASGSGSFLKITELIRGKQGADRKAVNDYKKNIKELEAALGKDSDAFKSRKNSAWNALQGVLGGNKAKYLEGLRGVVDDIFKEQMSGYDLSDWSHKTLEEILKIKEAVKNVKLSEDTKELLLANGGQEALDAVNEALDNYKDTFIDNTVDPKVMQKWSKYAKQLSNYLSKAGDAMKRLGEATNNTGLAEGGEAISAIGQNLSAAADGFGKGGWIGAIVGGAVDLFDQIVDAIAGANEEMKKMEATVRDIRFQAESEKFKELLSLGTDGIFGDNFVARVRNAVNGLDEARKKIDELTVSFEKYRQEQMKLAGMGGVGSLYYGLDAFGLGSTNPEDMLIRTKHSFWKGDTYGSIASIAKDFNMELRDAYDNLNPALLQKIIDTYGELNDGLIEWLTGATEYSTEYADAMKQIEGATQDIFGNLASDMADKFIDNFLQMGNAVDDLSDTFADLGDAILRSFLQSYILDEILGKYKEQANDALKKYSTGQMTPEGYAAWLDGFADSVQKESETLAPAINGMIEAFKDRGLMNIDENTANSLGSGIKSITEDTANLLASYINAIRADVSYIRVMQEKGWGAVESLGGALPTLQDYLAQIAATNYDTAQATNRILSELQSVIGAPGTSGMVVRVESA